MAKGYQEYSVPQILDALVMHLMCQISSLTLANSIRLDSLPILCEVDPVGHHSF